MATPTIENLTDVLKKQCNVAEIIDAKITNLTAPGENFGSTMLKLEVVVINENGVEEIIHGVAKTIPPLEFQQQVFNIQVTFKNEIEFYKNIGPLLQDFQKEHGVKNVVDFFPKFYGARINLNNSDKVDKDAVLILENLIVSGFQNVDRHVGYDFASAKVTLKDLAALHAISLAIKLKKPTVFAKRIRPYLVNKIDMPHDDSFSENNNMIVDLLWQSESCLKFINAVKQNIRAFPPNREYEVREPFATFAHCDLWVNNCMIKFQNGKPTQNKFVDFQLFNYKSPAVDLLFFLFTSVKLSDLQDNVDVLLKYYHDNFLENLKQLDCDTTPFSYQKFKEELNIEAKGIFCQILMFCAVIVFGQKGVQMNPPSREQMADPDFKDRMRENMRQSIILPAKEKIYFTVKEFASRGWL